MTPTTACRVGTCLALVLLPGGVSRAQARAPMSEAVSPRAATAHFAGRAHPNDSFGMHLIFRLDHQGELTALLAAQQRPGAPEYHRWLTPQEFTRRFAVPPERYDAVAQWLSEHGFSVRRHAHRLRLDFRGSVAQVENTFGVHMNYYTHAGRMHLANADPPSLPSAFAGDVALLRLTTFPVAHPAVRIVEHGVGTDVMAARDLQIAYNALPLLQSGMDGSGQTIAVVARSDFKLSDVAQFQQQFGTAVHAPQKLFPGGNPGIGSADDICTGLSGFERDRCIQAEEQEVLLDVEWANALAPGATVVADISDADIDQSFTDIVTHHPEAKIITITFGDCERLNPSDRTLFGPLYAQAAAQGQTVLVASGDCGADDCGDGIGASVDVLASDPNVTAVGGTALNPNFDASGDATGYLSEEVWNDGSGASGGGASMLVTKPDYQGAPGVPDDGARDVPDVALLADPAMPGYVTVVEGQARTIGGTSAGVPAWAGIVALLNQSTGADGGGAINPHLYAIGRSQYGSGAGGPFHDIISGDNSVNGVAGYNAGPGYDLVTGLGSPDVAALVQAWSAAACAGDCNRDGTVTVAELVTGVDILLGEQPLSACAAIDGDGNGTVTVADLINAVNRLLGGC